MDLLRFILFMSVVLPIDVTFANELKLKVDVFDGNKWSPSSSVSIPVGSPFLIRCTVDGRNDQTLSWNKMDSDSRRFIELENGSNQEVSHKINEVQLVDSGTYSCNCSAFSAVFELYVYNLTLHNASVPTRVEFDHIGKLQLVRRSLDLASYNASTGIWLSCALTTGKSHSIEMITVHWEGGLFDIMTNQTELQSLYTREFKRNVSIGEITTQLSLLSPILDPRAYGEYRCVFGFPSGDVIGRVYLHVPPILRLPYDPPPLPPANFSSRFICADPPCVASIVQSSFSDSSVVNWTSACEVVVSYPPLLPDGLTWVWTNAHWAAYAVERVKSVGKSNYLSELRAMESNKMELVSPWQVLERRRRDIQVIGEPYEVTTSQPSVPVVFLCWAKNELGRTAIWWPGPAEDRDSHFWASVWWPVLGVALEIASLVVVFGLFRCCSRGGRLRSYFTGQQSESPSFGLSRLVDPENSAEPVHTGRRPDLAKRNAHSRPPGNVPYVRLSNTVQSGPNGVEFPSTPPLENNNVHGHVNPILEEGFHQKGHSRPIPEEHDGEEYFWDSDTESNAPVSQK